MRPRTDARMVHKLVRDTAQEMAGAYYELAAGKHPGFYQRYPHQKEFIKQNWKNFVVTARQVMGQMLGEHYPPKMKAEIYEALCLDGTLPYAPNEAQIVNVPH